MLSSPFRQKPVLFSWRLPPHEPSSLPAGANYYTQPFYQTMLKFSIACSDKNLLLMRRAEERRMELQGTVADGNRSATVRSLAQHELDALSAVSYEPTAEERAAFDGATRAGTQAVADLRTAQTVLRDALADARAELDRIRGETTGKVDIDLMERWLINKQDEFDRL